MSAVHIRVRAGGENYAFPVEAMREVAMVEDLTPVPGAGDGVIGVRNLRGQLLPVVDLLSALGLPRSQTPKRLVVVESARGLAGIAVDELVGVGPLPAMSEPVESPALEGAAVVDGALVGAVRVGALLDAVAQGGRQ